MTRQVYIHIRGGLTQDSLTPRQLEKESMQDSEPGSGTCMLFQIKRMCLCICVCVEDEIR